MNKPTYIIAHKVKGVRNVQVSHRIYGEPALGSYASYVLMKRELWMEAANWHLSDPEGWRQLQFNQNFLRTTLDKHGELHCEYCGKPDLTLKESNHVRKEGQLIATVDHFIPKSLDKVRYGYDLNNLIVACEECNRRKSDKIWSPDTLKYKYK